MFVIVPFKRQFDMQRISFALSLLAAALLAGCATQRLAPTPPSGALDSANYLLERAYQGDAEAFFASLPESYRQNIRMLVSVAARSMDDDLWYACQGLLMDAAEMLDAQSGHIADFFNEEPFPFPTRDTFIAVRPYDVRRLGRSLSHAVRRLDRAALREGRIESFLSDSGTREFLEIVLKLGKKSGRWMEPFRPVEGAAPEVMHAVYWAGEQPVTNVVQWTNVEGRWVPKTWALAWPFVAGEALSNIDRLPKDDKGRTMFLTRIWLMRKQIRLMTAAGSQEEFEAALLPFLRLWL